MARKKRGRLGFQGERDPDINALTFFNFGEPAAQRQLSRLQEHEQQTRGAGPAVQSQDNDSTRQQASSPPAPAQTQSTELKSTEQTSTTHTEALPASITSIMTCKYWLKSQKGLMKPCWHGEKCKYLHADVEAPLIRPHIDTPASTANKAVAILITDDLFADQPELATSLLQRTGILAAGETVQNRPRRVVVARPELRNYLRDLMPVRQHGETLSPRAELYLEYLRLCPRDNMDETRHTLFTHPFTDHRYIDPEYKDGTAVERADQLVRGFVPWSMRNASRYGQFIIVYGDKEQDPRGWIERYRPHAIEVRAADEFLASLPRQ